MIAIVIGSHAAPRRLGLRMRTRLAHSLLGRVRWNVQTSTQESPRRSRNKPAIRFATYFSCESRRTLMRAGPRRCPRTLRARRRGVLSQRTRSLQVSAAMSDERPRRSAVHLETRTSNCDLCASNARQRRLSPDLARIIDVHRRTWRTTESVAEPPHVSQRAIYSESDRCMRLRL